MTMSQTTRTPYKKSILMIHVPSFYVDTMILTPEQTGNLIDKIAMEAITGTLDISKYRFIEKYRKLKSSRIAVDQKTRKEVLSVGFCNYCGSVERLEVDHILPLAKGGDNSRNNLQCLCHNCNHKKRDKIYG